MTPIEKNIRVIDDGGNEYEETFIKRANGLVKKGRARFVDKTTICLVKTGIYTQPACNYEPEIKYMVNNLNDNIDNNKLNLMQTSNKYEETPDEPSMKYILSRIDMIIKEKDYIENALTAIQTMQLNESANGGFGDQARAEAIQSTVQSRETTNQKILDMLDKMYDDLKPRQSDYKEIMLQKIIDATDNSGPFTEEKINLIEKFNEILDSLRHINR